LKILSTDLSVKSIVDNKIKYSVLDI